MSPLLFALWCLFSYLLGSISWSYFFARRLRGVDPRAVGSGNLGATNAGRILGVRWAVAIYLLDFTKGLLACGIPKFAWDTTTWNGIPIAVPAGLAVMLGHIFPFYLRFKGGKGVATGSGVMLAIHPLTGGIALAVWLFFMLTFRMVSAASIAAALSLPVAFALTGPVDETKDWTTGFFAAAAVLVAVMHRSNIARIVRGSEPRIRRSSS